MAFWNNGVVLTILMLAGLLAAGELILLLVPPLRRVGIPASIIGGTLGLLLGPSVLGLLPIYSEVLEAGVYHGLAVVFVALSLCAPAKGGSSGGARSMAFGITAMVATQTAVGLAVVLLLTLLLGVQLHPGFGLMLPLGFEQGPGQALSLGTAWEVSGMPNGGQVGLIIAALGFAWSVFVGVPLVAWGRARGLVAASYENAGADVLREEERVLPGGALDLLSRQIVLIGVVLIATYGACLGLSRALAFAPDIAGMVWGFHFMIGAVIAMGFRALVVRFSNVNPLHNGLLGRIAGITVDFATCAALCAVQLAVLSANWVPILAVTTVGGLATLAVVLLLSKRVFPDAPFEHSVLWFGMSTGTLPMGLALLRMVDPELRSSAPASAVLGSAGAILGVAPIVLVIHPIPIAGWQPGLLGATWMGLGLSLLYLAVTGAIWYGVNPARNKASAS